MATKKIITKKTPVKSFRLFDFHIYDDYPSSLLNSENDDEENNKKEQKQFIIQMFGINEIGETCSINITNYQPYFYVKVGDNWHNSDATALYMDICKKQQYIASSIVSYELEEHKKLYGFTAGKKYKFIKFVFKNTITMNIVKNMWYEKNEETQERYRKGFIFKGTNLELYESNIPPLLRYFHIYNISPSGWVRIYTSKTKKPNQKTTTCNYEYICNIEALQPLKDKETCVPYKICSFDIEASSSHGDFPIPIKSYKRLAMNIVDCWNKLSQAEIIDEKNIVAKMIMAAFNHGIYRGIDLVYPKNSDNYTKDDIKKRIQLFISTPIADLKKNITEENKYILCIDDMFKQMNESYGNNEYSGDANDDSGEACVEESGYKKFKSYKSTKKQTIVEQNTIIDVLKNKEYDRDEKIKIVNETMVQIFPKLEGDKVTFIGSTFLNYGQQKPYMNHCVVLGTCDDVEGAVIETTETETELLLKWAELIQKENPDIIIGYNIFGFDYEFMFRRAQENHCEQQFLLLSRKVNEICGKMVQNDIGRKELQIENTRVVLASGEYDLRYYKTPGRLQIDMYTYFRRDFNLPSYKLDDVAGQFISDNIKNIEYITHEKFGKATELYSGNLTGLNINDYIHIEISNFTSDYLEDGKKFKVLDIYEKTVDNNSYNIILIGGQPIIDKSKTVKWGMAKDDVSPQDIFRLTNGTASDRAIVAKYCIQDCNLVHHLMNKIDVLTGYIEMSRICSVPISFLVFRGQGIKLTSYVAKKCREKGTLMPDLEKTKYADDYEGAIVLPPKCSMYMDNPVACVDYSSLYPSSMISNNLSQDSKVWTKEYDLKGNLVREKGEKDKAGNYIYDNLPGYEYVDITFDLYEKTNKNKTDKVKSGVKICRWAQLPNNQKSIMPSILEELLQARSDTRKLAKTEKDPFMQNILDKRQLGYKVTANSLYGQCGAKTSTFYEQDVAACTTATGRMMIIYAKRIIEEVYGNLEYDTEKHGPVLTKAEYVYGDSVAEYTPVIIRYTENRCETDYSIDCTTFIMDIARRTGNENWLKCTEPGKEEKEYCETNNVEIWTEKGWTRLHRIIRHKLASHKNMVRVVTDNGIVDVTDDHSLLTPNGEEISSKQCVVDETELLHHHFDDYNEIITEELLNYYEKKYNNNNHFINEIITPDNYETSIDSYAYPNILDVELYKKLKEKTINSEKNITIRMNASTDSPRIQLLMALVYKRLYHYGIIMKTTYSAYRDEYVLTYSPEDTVPFNNKIKYMKDISYDGYVYDLTTENHHFAAGIGNLIVHNTDSVFFTFNLEDPKTGEKIRGKKALEITIEIAQDAAKLCSRFLKPPMDLAYEKTLMPFVLLSKKRYVGMLYEDNPNKGKLKYMGLSLKRRDSCDYLKDVYGEILNILMKENDIKKSTDYLENALNDLIEGKVPMEKLMITRALRSDYKNPNQIAHKVLADRIGKRDQGNEPKPGDRIKFLFIENETNKKLLGERIETPDFIIENKLKIDYAYYITNQLMKPLQQLFGLAIEKIWEHQKKFMAIKTFKKDMDKLEKEYFDDYELLMKQKEKYCSLKIKALLFDKILTKITNKRNNVHMITNFYF